MSPNQLHLLRSVARVSGLLVAVAFVALVLGEIVSPHSSAPPQLREGIGIALLTASCLSILIAWRWELLGGIVSLGALASFVLTIRLNQPAVIGIVGLPGVLYLVDWVVHRTSRSHA